MTLTFQRYSRLLLVLGGLLFQMSISAAEPVRIALISDLHIMCNPSNAEQRGFSLHLDKTIEMVRTSQVAMVFVGGDMANDAKAWEHQQFKKRLKEFQMPVYYIPGNHDVGNKPIPNKTGAKKQEVTPKSLAAYEKLLGPSFFVTTNAGIKIIAANSALYGSRMKQAYQMWDMLERELEKPSPLPTVILQHHPPFLKKENEPGGEYFNMEPYPRARLLALAEQGKVQAILSGHLHQGLTNYVNDMLLYTTPPVSFGLPKNKQLPGWSLITVSTNQVTFEFRPLPKMTAPPVTSDPKNTQGKSRPQPALSGKASSQPDWYELVENLRPPL